jgi:exopolysaccharide biosynthesis WecB/TagA/CpsF family protein
MSSWVKCNVLGVGVSSATYEDAVKAVLQAAARKAAFSVSALAVHGVMMGALNASHGSRLNAFDLLVPDGQPVRWALKLLHGMSLADRVYGPELMRRVCREAARQGMAVFFYGSTAETLERMVASLRRDSPALKVAGTEASKFRRLNGHERDEMIERIRSSGAAITFVGLGCPRQEVWTYENTVRLGMPVLAVGAAFAFEAGSLAQAPAVLQRFGLEWAFRLAMEPRRLWRRYILLNPLYLLMIAGQWAGIAFQTHYDSNVQEERFG